MAAVWTDLLGALLAPSPEPALRWAGKGPGIGRDARIAYSSLLGRFVARAHLIWDLGVRVLVPLDVAKDSLKSKGFSIQTKRGDPGHRADWIGFDHQGLVIAEAKGNYSGSIASHALKPPPILRPAIGQVIRTEVWGFAEIPARRVAIATRWATERQTRKPELLVWDSQPSQVWQPNPALVGALSQADGIRVLRGMGYPTPRDPKSTVNPRLHRVMFRGREFDRGYIAIADALGVRPLPDGEARCPRVPAYLVFSEAHWTSVQHGEPTRFEPQVSERWARASGLSVIWPRPEDELQFLPIR